MKLIVNGELFETSKSGTIPDLLEELGIEPGRVAIEVNLTIVRKADYAKFRLHEGDRIEVVNFVGGG
jgi:thiamine biosynthesis protein ThiS